MHKTLLTLFFITNIYAFNFSQPVCNGIGEIKYTNALYTGECKNGLKNGRGRIVFDNGVKYEGSWKNNKKNGHGTQHYVNGAIYNGEWKNGIYDGEGTLKYNSTENYKGHWKNGKKNGKGKYTYATATYDGSWLNDAKHGYGVFRYTNGIVYKGNFVNNIQQGEGSISYKSGDKYKGGFRKAKQDGYGVFTFAQGGSYSGYWLMGKRHGKGKYIYSSGAIYDGEWVKDKKTGEGSYKDSLGNLYAGTFKNNKKHGYGVLELVLGEKYEGSWRKDKKEGYGVLTYTDGSVYDGLWHNDTKDGEGSLKSQYGTCYGSWRNSKLVEIEEKFTKADAYDLYNEIRKTVEMTPLHINQILQKTAQKHSDYIGLHNKGMKGLDFHKEKKSKRGFSGVKAKDRASKSGYFSANIGEGISNYCSAEQSINSLMSAIYHRFDILTFSKDEVGIGFTTDPKSMKRNFVHNTGNSLLNSLCKKNDRWMGSYYENVCTDKKIKIKRDPYNEAKEKVRKQNPKYVIWPAYGSQNNLYYFKDEVPNPMSKYEITGNPISIQFNPYYFPKDVIVYSFKLYDAKDEVIETELLTKQTDPNKRFSQYEYALFPLTPLKRDTEYTVVIKYKYEGTSKRISSSFRTMK